MRRPTKPINLGSVGGGSNTPPIDTLFNKPKLEKRVLIDWLSVSFDFVDVWHDGGRYFDLDKRSLLLRKLLSFFGWTQDLEYLQRGTPVRGYTDCYQIGEHIKIFFGGKHTLNANNRYSINLLMSGQACREFENYMDGNWNDLLSFLLSHDSKIKRIDIAIDDFEADEIDIYDIEPIIQKDNYICPMHSVQVIWSRGITEGIKTSTGYSLTFGSTGSNQLQIYDKRLERNAKGQIDIESNIWYRYELRFVDEKAHAVTEKYIACVKENKSLEFMTFTSELLYMTLDLKVPKKDTNKSRWKTLPKWKAFLNNVTKIKLDTKYKIDTTLIKKKIWFKSSYALFITKFLFGFDYSGQKQLTQEMWLDGIDKFTEKDLAQVNYYRIGQGLQELTMQDIKNTRQSVLLEMENEDE
jgi:hypothetical protein